MLTKLYVKRVEGSGQFSAHIKGAFVNYWVYGSSPSDALHRLAQHGGYTHSCFPPIVREVTRRYNLGLGSITDADLAAGIPTGTIIVEA